MHVVTKEQLTTAKTICQNSHTTVQAYREKNSQNCSRCGTEKSKKGKCKAQTTKYNAVFKNA